MNKRIFVINDKGERVLMRNIADLKAGDSVIVAGTAINQCQFVRRWNIKQMRKPEDNPQGDAVEVEVPQFHFNLGGRSFTITGSGLEEQGEALLATINGKAKGGERVKELYLQANEWHPQLTDNEGNPLWEDEEETVPQLNKEVVNRSFTYSGQSNAAAIAAEQDDELEYEAKKNKITLQDNATIAEMFEKFAAAKAGN